MACLLCAKVLNNVQKKYCSLSCSAKANNALRRVERHCPVCIKPLGSKQRICCSIACAVEKKYRDNVTKWFAGKLKGGTWGGVSGFVRRWLIEKYGENCALCGWDKRNPVTNLIPVQTDHIDGNGMNHRPENLRLLCPSCHSLTPTYGGLNRGKGRKERYAAIG